MSQNPSCTAPAGPSLWGESCCISSHACQSLGDAAATELRSFLLLRQRLASHPDHRDPRMWIDPYLSLLRSGETVDVMASEVLASLSTLVSHGLLDDSPGSEDSIVDIVDAVSNCRFEATSSDEYEVVLTQIADVLLVCLKCSAGRLLPDESVVVLLETTFRIALKQGLSRLLRKMAERTLSAMVMELFTTIAQPQEEELVVEEEEKKDDGVGVGGTISLGSTGSVADLMDKHKVESDYVNVRGVRFQKGADYKPHGIVAVTELLRFIATLLKPSNADDVRTLGLSLLNLAIESSSSCLSHHPVLIDVVRDDLWQHILPSLRTQDLLILSQALRLVVNLDSAIRPHLKPQMAAFFSFILRRLSVDDDMEQVVAGDVPGTPKKPKGPTLAPEEQEVFLQALGQFTRQPLFCSALYLNYDCDPQCPDVFESLCRFFGRGAFPVTGTIHPIHILSLDALLGVLRVLTSRCSTWEEGAITGVMSAVRQRKYGKRLLDKAVETFNSKTPEDAFEYLSAQSLLPDPVTPASLAEFLRHTPRLDRRKVGEYLGAKKTLNEAVLQSYVNTFDFSQLGSFERCIRAFLESFHIPGEAQMIARIVEAFAHKYYNDKPEGIPMEGPDTPYILAYSFLMLHTDLHSKRVRNKMSVDEFVKNNRGINGGKDLPREMLEEIYASVAREEIVTLDDSLAASSDQGAKVWEFESRRITKHGLLWSDPADNPSALDRDMFVTIWGPTVAAVSVTFDSSVEEHQLKRAQMGFAMAARVSAAYGLADVLDNIVVSLCRFSGLLQSDVTDESVQVFGRDRKAQAATRTMFNIARHHGTSLRDGWRSLTDALSTMFRMNILPRALVEIIDFSVPSEPCESISVITHNDSAPTRCLHAKIAPRLAKPAPSGGLLSAMGGWFWAPASASGSDGGDGDAEDEWRNKAVECVNGCGLVELFAESKFIDADSLTCLIRALAIETQGKPEVAAFFLELLIGVAIHNRDRIGALWPSLYNRLATIIDSPSSPHVLLERAVVGLLRLLIRLLHKEAVSGKLPGALALLHQMGRASWDPQALQIMTGLSTLVRTNAAYVTADGWEMICNMLKSAASHPSASSPAFDTLAFMLLDRACAKALLSNPVVLDSCLAAVREFIAQHPTDRSLQALDLLFALHSRTADLPSQVDDGFWMLAMQVFTKACRDHRREVRQHAFTCLERGILVPEGGKLSPPMLQNSFDQTLFPLLEALVQSADSGMEEARLKAFGLLCKFLLRYLPILSTLPSFMQVWMRTLAFAECYYRMPDQPAQAMAIKENLHNMLRVMDTIVTQDEEFWAVTWPLVHAFLPGLQDQLFGTKPVEEDATPATPPPSSPAPFATPTMQV